MLKRSKTIIISPSGNLYGSEQVLFDFLKSSKRKYKVYVPTKSILEEKLKKETNHSITRFSSIYKLYSLVLLILLVRPLNVYVNEGGHIRIISLLAKILPFRKFTVHIRMLSDTQAERHKTTPGNISFICVSNFIREALLKNNPKVDLSRAKVIYDPYLPEELPVQTPNKNEVIKFGFVGRISADKGIKELKELIEYWELNGKENIQIEMYGHFYEDKFTQWLKSNMSSLKKTKINIHGFSFDKHKIFGSFDILLQLNPNDAFPRVYFDAISRLKPVLGFKVGGMHEQSLLFGLDRHLIDPTTEWPKHMMYNAKYIHNNILSERNQIKNKLDIFEQKLNIRMYTQQIEKSIYVK